MKKKVTPLFLLITCFLFTAATPNHAVNEGIHFFEGTWQEALEKSSAEKKYIFLDLSTSWCGWCKKMRQTTYPDKSVGDYFNERFICVELDGEKGEGKRLAQKFGVTEYPSVFLLDSKEQPLLSSEGYHQPEDLLKLFKAAVKEK